jgi:predicted HNH restriction endonuclease
LAREAAVEGEEIPIDMYTGEEEVASYPSEDDSLDELRAEATEQGSATTSSTTTRQEQYRRSEAVKRYARKRADGECEGCGKPAPFESRAGHPYLEVHHVLEVSDDGPDQPDAVVALCPDCHRRVHHGVDGNEYNQQLIDELREMEGFGR